MGAGTPLPALLEEVVGEQQGLSKPSVLCPNPACESRVGGQSRGSWTSGPQASVDRGCWGPCSDPER